MLVRPKQAEQVDVGEGVELHRPRRRLRHRAQAGGDQDHLEQQQAQAERDHRPERTTYRCWFSATFRAFARRSISP